MIVVEYWWNFHDLVAGGRNNLAQLARKLNNVFLLLFLDRLSQYLGIFQS